jgi:hypothetical protein
MGLPLISVIFRELGITAIQRSQKGTLAIYLFDGAVTESAAYTLYSVTDVPEILGVKNREYLQRAFVGYVTPPKKIFLYVLPGSGKSGINDALVYFAGQNFDYLVGPPDLSAEDAQTVSSWVKSERLNDHTVKAVLPNTAADSEAIVNFVTGGIVTAVGVHTTEEFCSRIAGLIAGTPMTIACTYAPLPEVTDVERRNKDELDEAIDAGKFVIFHDGEKVKVGRGVNSFVTTAQDKGNQFKKIKIVEAVDMIKNDIRKTAQDNYIGRYANSYDNKCLLIMAVKGYFEGLELAGILEKGTSTVEINLERQAQWLKSKGIDTSDMTERQIKESNTESYVFIKAKISILDAIEDIEIDVSI